MPFAIFIYLHCLNSKYSGPEDPALDEKGIVCLASRGDKVELSRFLYHYSGVSESRSFASGLQQEFFAVDNCHVTVYSFVMIKTFSNKETQQLFIIGKSRRLAPDLAKSRKAFGIHPSMSLT
jgi:hypothetical protein